jgi:hypothetical protein
MNSDPHRELLDDLYPAPGAGPDCDAVLGMVRTHRAVRRRKTTASALVFALLAATFFLRDPAPKVPPPLAKIHPPQMPRINDEELLDIVGGQAAAIATLPDGSQRLLLIVPAGGR